VATNETFDNNLVKGFLLLSGSSPQVLGKNHAIFPNLISSSRWIIGDY